MEEQILAKLDRILAVTETIDISSAVILIGVIISIIVSILRNE